MTRSIYVSAIDFKNKSTKNIFLIPGGIGLNRASCDNFFSLIFSVRQIVIFLKNNRKQNFRQLELLICINSKWPPHWNRILVLAPKPLKIID